VNRRRFLKRTGSMVVGGTAMAELRAKPARAAQVKRRSNKRIILTDDAPKPAGPYNQAIVAGNTIYVAGQVPINPRTGKMITGGIEEQANLVFDNLGAILKAAGASFADVAKVNVYLSDPASFSKMNEVYRRYFPQGGYPARTTVAVQMMGDFLIEVDCVAVKSETPLVPARTKG
jgi:2-iminobutanoate/2-iminopropanoate deaminase